MPEKARHTTPRDGPELDLSYFLFNCTLDANWNKANCQDKHDLFFKNKTMHVWKNAPKCQQRKNICQNFSTDKLLACLSSKMMNWWIASSFDTYFFSRCFITVVVYCYDIMCFLFAHSPQHQFLPRILTYLIAFWHVFVIVACLRMFHNNYF